MKRNSPKKFLLFALLFCVTLAGQAQYLFNSGQGGSLWNSDSAFKAGVPNSGRLWGYIFGDYFHKAHSDSLNRGGNNQYTGVKKDIDQFQFRRIYLGYDYNISRKFMAEVLLAAEDDFVAPTQGTGDLLANNKFVPYIKLANLRWRDFLWKGNDFVIGMQPTPAFPYVSENIFTYSRPIERTLTDIRRTPSYDFGAGLQGRFQSQDKSTIFGYDFLVANSSGDKPQALNVQTYKWWYADAFVGLLNHRLIIDLYQDYNRQAWFTGDHGHAYRAMTKGVVTWVDKKFTLGVEAFTNTLGQCEVGTRPGARDTLDGHSHAITFYGHVNLVGSKLRFWARYDMYNPNTKYDNSTYTKYATLYGVSTTYEPNNKERFLSTGFDYSPAPNVHFMPNIWYNKYIGQQAGLGGRASHDYDLVYRLTFYFTFGKLFANPNYSYYPYLH
ncbi:MAG TPA: hypothetical protein VHE54_03355 [Puia sp.]|nr:hypothetical protein [Puia sp.]